MHIITVAREFGSGGRELGKRLADLLGFDYYDREIIAAIAEKHGLSEGYVDYVLENHAWTSLPITFHHSFHLPVLLAEPQTKLISTQREVIEKIAAGPHNAVIVGRQADVILEEYHPFRIFVCAAESSRVRRCMERAPEGENLTAHAVRKNMRVIDKNRAKSREFLSDLPWGSPASYDLTVNTTDCEIKALSEALAAFLRCRLDLK